MQMTDANHRTTDLRVAVAIDLIGDLDATLGGIFSDTLSHLVSEGTRDVLLTTKHVTLSSEAGISAIDSALGSARAMGCAVRVEPGSRRMKAAFAAARVAVANSSDVVPFRPRNGRHLMLARHAVARGADRRSA
jgi:anti-anti-sigma regulatory factor